MSILPLLLSLLAANTVSCSEGVSRLELLKMVQNLTGRVEQLEQGRNLTDEVGKLGDAMTGAVEKLGEKLTQGLGEAMTGAVEKLGDKTEKLGEAMTGAMEKLGEKLTQGLGEAMTGAMEKLGDKTETLGESLTNAIQHPYTPSSCYDVMPLDVTDNVHVLKVNDRYIRVFCDQRTAGGGWTVIQRRQDGSVDFYRNWTEYRQGFGDIQGNFWLGLDNIHLLTTARSQTLRVDLEDFDNNTAYAEYRFFAIDGPDSFYRLHLDGYTGTAGDSLAYHYNPSFSTHDSDHDISSGDNCAVDWHGAWWYGGCAASNLNGPYLTSAQQAPNSIYWYHWKNAPIALKHVEMKIRPAM